MLRTNELIAQPDQAPGLILPAATAPLDLVRVFARIARDFADQPDTAAFVQRIADIGFTMTGCPSVAVVRSASAAVAKVRASTGGSHGETDCRITCATRQGMVTAAAVDRSATLSNDIAVEARWPEYTSKILALTSIRSILAVPLLTDRQDDDGQPVDVLVFYADRAHFFSDDIREKAAVLADLAAIALDYNRARDHAANLTVALKTSREIGAAMGILMERHKLTENAAFDVLKSRSQDLNVKLHTVAMSLNISGELPTRTGP